MTLFRFIRLTLTAWLGIASSAHAAVWQWAEDVQGLSDCGDCETNIPNQGPAMRPLELEIQ